MKFLFLFLIIISYLFSCDISDYNKAYQNYFKNQRTYIKAILDNNKKEEIKALKEIIKCGKYLKFDVSEYEKKLSKLSPQIKINLTPSKKIFSSNKLTKIKILSIEPIKIKLSSNTKIIAFTENRNNTYKKIIDIKNAYFPKKFLKKNLKKYKLKIAQFNKSTVRIVISSNKRLVVDIKKNNNILSLIIRNKKGKNILNKTIRPNYKQKIIVIDPGHGGKDKGGIGIGNIEEKNIVLKIAKYLKYYLQKEGYKVYLTRNRDIFKKLKYRTHFANKHKADLFISIHCNISPHHIKSPHGIETYYLSPAKSKKAIRIAKIENKEIKNLNYLDQNVILNFLNKDRIISSTKLAIDVQSNILKSLRQHFNNVKDGGIRPAPFWVLVGTQMPAILIETGFLTNPREAKRLSNPYYQKLLAKGIAKGVKAYFIKNSK